MGKKHFTEEQIAYALRQQEAGTPVAELTRKLGNRRFIGGRRSLRVWVSLSFVV